MVHTKFEFEYCFRRERAKCVPQQSIVWDIESIENLTII